MNWTKDQQKVIDLRDKNILVSAAAGSGKTAVLVERIITKITEGDNPIDIDRLLIVTFTNAAAAEMRERIGQAVEKKLDEDPGNLHLQKQMMLIHTAQITTIHSFCLYVIRNYFNTIHIDPSFRVANESELVLLKSDVIEELLEDQYEQGSESFLHFIECFATGKTDQAIEDLILKLHEFSMSFPWPEEWLDEKIKTFDIDSVEDMENSDWMVFLKLYLDSIVEDIENKYIELVALCKEPDGPYAYLDAIISDMEYLDNLKGLSSFEEYYQAFTGFMFKSLSRKKQKEASEDKKAQVKNIREEVKKLIKNTIKQFFFQNPEEMVLDIKAMKPAVEVLIKLTKEFTKLYNKKKSERNLVDFNDLEHLCLDILVRKDGGSLEYTPVADELAGFYDEILIDEYQDSNLVQETILNSISKERYGSPNRFMVGDVKQSIYKFRLARPEIFMEKYEEYKSDDELMVNDSGASDNKDRKELKYQKVDLHQNFRSRDIVLNTVNSIFEQIMTKKIGNISYDNKAALYPGASYPSEGVNISKTSEIILVSPEKNEDNFDNLEDYLDVEEGLLDEKMLLKDFAEIDDLDEKELEAKAIANKIKELVSETEGLDILDKATKEYRKAQYKDIVILLRTMTNWADVFVEVLSSEGIPCYAQTQTGYFNTLEIKTILNIIRIIDNPRQDIPLVAVLRCPVVGLNSNELARIRITRRDIPMYEAVIAYRDEHLSEDKKDGLALKLDEFLSLLDHFRSMVPFLRINELLIKVLEETGYYNFASSMPGGEKRKANIDMLIQKAIQFEETSYSGLFHFIRYIEKLQKYNVDFGEADAVSGSDNSVRIMSIHKSKGLEFPVVFCSGMGKTFNQQDARAKMLIHPDLGLGPDFINPDMRVKSPTLLKKVIQNNIVIENLGEELRILYVAMTRAKEKLIITGAVKKLEDQLVKWKSICKQETKELSFYQISKAKTFLDLIIPAVLRLDGLEVYEGGKPYHFESKVIIPSAARIIMNILDFNDLAVRELVEQIEKEEIKEELRNWDTNHVYNKDIREKLEDLLKFKYKYEAETKIHTKLTVTELKRLSQLEEEDSGFRLKLSGQRSDDLRVPNFISNEEPVKGAQLGSTYHKILDNKSILNLSSKEDLNKYLTSLYNSGSLTLEELESIDKDRLLIFLNSDLAKRMSRASKENCLYTEAQFIIGLKANEINNQLKSDELVLVQGVIDVYFEEDGELVLVDYKTDKVDKRYGEETLRKRYSIQLDYYERALRQLTNKNVKERIIYSFELNKAIEI